MKWVRASGLALSIAIFGVLAAGCTSTDETRETGGVSNVDMQGAAEEADAMLDATVAAIVPSVEWAHHLTTAGSCQVNRRRTVTTVISQQRRGNFLGVIERFWRHRGYTITSVNQSREMPAIFARSQNGFQLQLSFGYKGQAFFEVATPCVAKSDVAGPTSVPNGPAYPPGEIPTPNVRSGFWSSEEPLSRS
ncbi:hypothetical protein [Streptomyces lavendofoliae]|uniref:hypothetical protein n=1 Tax=Streptomyces lavendofoliae TaxID=67314 RepID=UPI003D905872